MSPRTYQLRQGVRRPTNRPSLPSVGSRPRLASSVPGAIQRHRRLPCVVADPKDSGCVQRCRRAGRGAPAGVPTSWRQSIEDASVQRQSDGLGEVRSGVADVVDPLGPDGLGAESFRRARPQEADGSTRSPADVSSESRQCSGPGSPASDRQAGQESRSVRSSRSGNRVGSRRRRCFSPRVAASRSGVPRVRQRSGTARRQWGWRTRPPARLRWSRCSGR